jgi:hypothetical protein
VHEKEIKPDKKAIADNLHSRTAEASDCRTHLQKDH